MEERADEYEERFVKFLAAMASYHPLQTYDAEGSIIDLVDIPSDLRFWITNIRIRKTWCWDGPVRINDGQLVDVFFADRAKILKDFAKWLERIELQREKDKVKVKKPILSGAQRIAQLEELANSEGFTLVPIIKPA